MAYHYKEFTVVRQRYFHYRFTCEYCGKTTDWIRGTVYGEALVQTSTRVDMLSEEHKNNLNKEAIDDCNGRYARVQGFAQTGRYGDIHQEAQGVTHEGSAYRDYSNRDVGFPANCPFCDKAQSWRAASHWILIYLPVIFFPFLVSFLWFVFTGQFSSHSIKEFFDVVPFNIWKIGFGTGLFVGIFWYLCIKIKESKGRKGKNKPEFRWS